jgi:hypothetical protein
MTNYNEHQLIEHIQQLIDKNVCGIDGFFTDSRTAARDILKYLMAEKVLIKNEVAVEIEFKKQSQAA